MNLELLRAVYAENAAAQAICDHLSERAQNQKETKLHRMVAHLKTDGYEFKRSELIAAFRRLEEAGVGKYIEGRHGHKSRFIWEEKSLSVAAHATNSEVLPSTSFEDDDMENDADFVEHTFMLRTETSVSIELPANLSKNEAARLANFILTLPFEG